jgi:2-oxopent-4-enoate/cis-2-oxohex-4-enoate hydratase
MTPVWEDPRVRNGMGRQLAERQRRLREGEQHRGWKVAFNTPAAFDRLGIDSSLIGFFTDRNVVHSGGTIDLSGWTNPVLECEIAAYIGDDIPAGATSDEVRPAIAAIGPGLELADFDAALMDDPEAVLAGDIFHRFMVLGEQSSTRAGADVANVRAQVRCGDESRLTVESPTAVTGDLVDVVRYTADYLGGCGAQLRRGDIVMTGSMVPLIDIAAPQHWTLELDPIGEVSVDLSDPSEVLPTRPTL